MRSLLEYLADYANENLVGARLQAREFSKKCLSVEERWEDFRAMLTVAQRDALEAIQDEESRLQYRKDLDFFRAGISIGKEFSRY